MKTHELFKTFFVVVLFVSVVIIAIGGYNAVFAPTEGEVTQKIYHQAHRTTSFKTPVYEPESYQLYVKNVNEDGKEVYGVIAVDGITFHSVEIGDWFEKKCMCVVKR
jgi:hypothetical protein